MRKTFFKPLLLLSSALMLYSCSDMPGPEPTVTPTLSTVTGKEQVPASTEEIPQRDGSSATYNKPAQSILHTDSGKAVSVDKGTYDKTRVGDRTTTGAK